ncbi:Retrovirus-related Pol polyprotein from transposon 412 [Araneus ventricosus]|uniref:Retrovirus-related Pol polyprotein from transposon 412 n=1 Tax=Araneus ventricosus TaxID=182803 RepID=A0A4Y2QXX8_ARAVE|nr:Retrovirus-related Pol polyprotein from transposon 412 [Araneus ventricosus]
MGTYIFVKVLTSEDPWSSSEIQKAQLEDSAIRSILEKKLNSEDRPSWQEIAPESPATERYWVLWNSLHLKDGVLYRNASGGHFGVIKRLSKTREDFVGIDFAPTSKNGAENAKLPEPEKDPRQEIKWPEAIPIPDQEASTVVEELVLTWTSRYGVPMILHLDQGTNFNSALFTELCKLLGILKTRTTALHPESDGMVQRFNRTILNHLFLFVSKNQNDWDSHLPLFLLTYRSADHEATGFTPAQMLFGRTLRLPCDILFGRSSDTPSSPNEYLNNLEVRLESLHAFARERIKLASERMKTRYDSGATDHHFKDGDQIWMYNQKRRRGLSPKLCSRTGKNLILSSRNSMMLSTEFRGRLTPSQKSFTLIG